MHTRSTWPWLARTIRTLYTEVVLDYMPIYCCEEHEVVCTCSDCIYLPLTILLEEYLGGNEGSRWYGEN